jgi:pimeloyl-ACP methyl ester carboxylesterase
MSRRSADVPLRSRRFAPRHAARTVIVAILTGTAGCAVGLLYPAPPQMTVMAHYEDPEHPTRCLVVFLPGFGDGVDTFARHGFLEALRERHIRVDSVSAGATLGYYSRHEVVQKLHEDVLTPLAPRRYRQIWVVGVSMGGYGALLLAKDPSVHVDGMFLLAPYLGDLDRHPLLEEIDRAGGLLKWSGAPSPSPDETRDVWRFLKGVAENPSARPEVHLGAGDGDPLKLSHRLLADALPEGRFYVTAGSHDWPPWQVLWARFLDNSDFRTRCAP